MKACFVFFIVFAFSLDLFSATPILEADIALTQVTHAPKAIPTLKTLLIICDNYINPENNQIAQGVRTDMATVNLFLNTLANRGIAKVDKQVLQGRQATQANIVATLKSMQTNADDIVLVYFSGHGGMASGKSFLFTSDEKNLMRADVQAFVNTKPSRLKMIITDACNNETEGFTASRSLSRGATSAMEGKFDAVYKELLYKYQGMLHLSASSEGQFAWSDDNLGGFFTHYFFKEGLIKNPSNSWESVFAMARDKTSQMFGRMPDEQKRQLASEGVKDQTAKAYALPKSGSTTVVPPVSTPTATPTSAPIVIWNATQKNINFFLDKNTDMNQWVSTKLEKKLAAPDASLQLKGPKATIGFMKGKEQVYYELESGNYFFDYNEFNQLDLFMDEEGVDHEEISKKDYTKLMLGKWEYLDESESIQMTFDAKGKFHEKLANGEVITEGSWKISQIEDSEEKKTYPVMVLSQVEDGIQIDLHYLIQMDNGLVQLIYFAAYANGQYVEEDEETANETEDESDQVILLYKAK